MKQLKSTAAEGLNFYLNYLLRFAYISPIINLALVFELLPVR